MMVIWSYIGIFILVFMVAGLVWLLAIVVGSAVQDIFFTGLIERMRLSKQRRVQRKRLKKARKKRKESEDDHYVY